MQILLILQNRGLQTSRQLADELEVTPRTILRDVDAMTEAGLPVIVHRGSRGGIELGFNYRTRLTGLAADEAEALGVLLAMPAPALDALGLAGAANRARAKLLESFPDGVRDHVAAGHRRFRVQPVPEPHPDPRIAALAAAVRDRRIVRLRARSPAPFTVYPIALTLAPTGWLVTDGKSPDTPIPMREWGDLNVSGRQFPDLDLSPATGQTALGKMENRRVR